ncbi:MAG TPA: cytochrome c3 family protein, partial [Gemmataceae bacterium]|nr:cytochrome c3 family protein [Gemmataceae bacterium]
MADPKSHRTAAAGFRALLLIALCIAVGGVGWLVWKSYFASQPSESWAASPFRNVRPGVQYVGDRACVVCHKHEADSFHAHPMGRSFTAMPAEGNLESYDTAARNPFEAAGLQYRVDRQGREIVHNEILPRPKGASKFESSYRVRFALGSGSHGRAYLIDRDGFLFQSPISWYTQRRAWDLSPGYDRNNQHFERPITGECLFCHSNYSGPVEHTLNRYQEPVFAGSSIGCERCHGPGELHVKQPGEKVDGIDYTIVNPKHLSPELRESVCQQCHLQGAVRIVRRGQQPFDFRPGLPLHLFRSIFVRPEGVVDDKAVSQVEQMYSSKCFQASKGALGCITCHNPHDEPAPTQRVDYYRNRCLDCHKRE